ncbi:hypothetical protein SAMN05192549_10128 [Duganella sacchari]|uniref:YbgS-like protein n=1 Tax=Duganella sacchari TaxID=551987 RepID=A0A1M7H1S5_9BURK|nr:MULTISPECIES: hypothetical protein [Duganella]MYM27399.1 hypothetical protein [Duganella sp. CY15W]SHM22333.1 hypothetical protein SAMN05192549_10128 [Duganella sacchari]
MNIKAIACIATLCLSSAAIAQTQPSGTSNTGTPTKGQSMANSGEQNATTMQNNSNMQNTAPAKNAKHSKMKKSDRTKMDCNQAHTDGNSTTPADTVRADCDNTTKTQR